MSGVELAEYPSYSFHPSGDIYSKRKGRMLIPLVVPNGYRHVVLVEGGIKKRLAVHRIISTAFHGAPQAGQVTNHKNGIKHDNRADNLEWVTQSYNVKNAYAMGLRTINDKHKERCAALGRARKKTVPPQMEIAR